MVWVVPPPRMPVTTRIITFLVGDSGDAYKPPFASYWEGDNPMYGIFTYIWLIFMAHVNIPYMDPVGYQFGSSLEKL